MALFKIIAETFLQGKDGVSILQKLQQTLLLLSSKGLMVPENMFFIEITKDVLVRTDHVKITGYCKNLTKWKQKKSVVQVRF